VTRTFICLAFFLATGKQIAYVDLTLPPKTPELNTSGTQTNRHSGGGVYDRRAPDPQTPPVSVKLSRILSSADSGGPGDSVEVVLTNTGEKEITIPIGNDPVPILAPYATDRRELRFRVLAGEDAYDLVGWGTSVSSAAYADSLAHLAPGDSVTYRLPIDRSIANRRRALRNGAGLQLTVRVQLGRVIIDQGSDLHADAGGEIRSENSLPWPPE
jgi:hypothetical protein